MPMYKLSFNIKNLSFILPDFVKIENETYKIKRLKLELKSEI